MKRDEVFEFFRRLAEENPSPTTELEYENSYTLLVAVVLSAQATDAGVNLATRPLFKRVQTPELIDTEPRPSNVMRPSASTVAKSPGIDQRFPRRSVTNTSAASAALFTASSICASSSVLNRPSTWLFNSPP